MMRNKVLVIGELCTDVFKYGITNRKSPEGNGPVFVQTDMVSGNGMAGNTAMNLEAMGLDVDTYFDNGKIMKTRYVNRDTNELYLRVDVDDVTDRIDIYDLPDLVKYDAVVISDYCKGFLTEEDINTIASMAKFTILDTKKKLGDWCKNVSFIKVNRFEAYNNKDIIYENKWLEDKLIITLDGNGASYKDKVIKTEYIENADVSGAGDTFVAGFVARYLDSNNIEESIDWANYCAGEVVKQKGVTVFKKNK
jgi:D-beta-D-heptose 7-phosphate kinase/D-beta-D-heptose 1-phosphate adenosyltransferase